MSAAARGIVLAIGGAGCLALIAPGVAHARQGCVTGFVPTAVNIQWTGTTESAPAALTLQTSSGSCAWAFEEGVPSWLGIPSLLSGVGPRTITFPNVMPNIANSPRTAILTIDGRQVTFTQGINPCPVSLSPPQASIPANGGQATFTIDVTGSGCSYAVLPDPGITVVSGGSGSVFPATLVVSAGPNTTTGVLNRGAEVSTAGIFFPGNPRVLVQQNGPPVVTDAPVGGMAFALHRGTSGPPHLTVPEPIRITNAENPTLPWTSTTTQAWLVISPTHGTSPDVATISIDESIVSSFPTGTFTAAVDLVSPIAPQTIRRVNVTLRITSSTSLTGPPIGILDTPLQNATGLSGAVAVTGWAIDDVGIARVQIFREPISGESPGEVFIGHATRVRGARTDVVAALPGRPELTSAGWGLMILSNVLPNGGNGPFTLSAYAEDIEGHRTLLGQRTVTFDNTNSPRPFGTIDFPEQGGTMSGLFQNQGWILAQPGRFIPFNGSTIRLIVDGEIRPNVAAYGSARPDVAALFPFPPYSNSSGPAGQFSIDTTAFVNGLHTIVWLVTDDDGVSQGIGSRFVNIQNPSGGGVTTGALEARSASEVRAIPQATAFVWERKGFDDGGWSLRFAGGRANVVEQAPGERLEVALDTWWWSRGCGPYAGYLVTGDVAAPLPPGASIDGEQGVFRWMPPAGFAGAFEFVFVRRACTGREERIPLRVIIRSK